MRSLVIRTLSSAARLRLALQILTNNILACPAALRDHKLGQIFLDRSTNPLVAFLRDAHRPVQPNSPGARDVYYNFREILCERSNAGSGGAHLLAPPAAAPKRGRGQPAPSKPRLPARKSRAAPPKPSRKQSKAPRMQLARQPQQVRKPRFAWPVLPGPRASAGARKSAGVACGPLRHARTSQVARAAELVRISSEQAAPAVVPRISSMQENSLFGRPPPDEVRVLHAGGPAFSLSADQRAQLARHAPHPQRL
jgi:hypothetical protein